MNLSRAVSRFSRGPVAGTHRQHFFGPTGSKYTITKIVHRIEKTKNPTGPNTITINRRLLDRKTLKTFFSVRWTIV